MKTSPRQRLIATVALGALALTVLVVAVWPGEREPQYQGKKLSEWLEIYSENEEAINQEAAEASEHGSAHNRISPQAFVKRREAEAAIVAMGTNNMPQLLRWLDYKPSKVREWVVDHSGYLPEKLTPLLEDRGDERAELAHDTFVVLGVRGAWAIPKLIKQAKEHVEAPDSRAFDCLSSMGEVSFLAVSAIAVDSQSPARWEAIDCVGGMKNSGTNRVPAVRQLCALANDPDKNVVESAFTALGQLAAEPEIALPVLIQGARCPDVRLAATALNSIGKFGTNAGSAMPELINALGHQNARCRQVATNAVFAAAPEFFQTNGIQVGIINSQCIIPR